MLRLAASVSLLVLAGCASPISDLPPASRIDVAEGYAESLDDAALAVVVAGVTVTDDAVATHLGGDVVDMDETYWTFFAAQLPVAFRTARVGEVRVFTGDVAPGAQQFLDKRAFEFGDFEPDLVLLLDTLHVRRATYYTHHTTGVGGVGQPPAATTTTSQQKLRIDTDVVLWDRAREAEVASGRLETERALEPIGRSRSQYEDAVRELVEQLARFTPLEMVD